MNLKEFIRDLQESASELDTEDVKIRFATSPGSRLEVLSIYDGDDKRTVWVDLGPPEERTET